MSNKKVKLFCAPVLSMLILGSTVFQGVMPDITHDDEIKNDIPVVETISEPVEPQVYLSESDINLIALITMAEAEGQPELAQRLVIDTILNRMDHYYWPNTVQGVIYQKNQFSCVWNGRVNRCYVKEDIYNLVKEELASRTNRDVVYFRAGRYSSYGTPLCKEGDHYFSSL